jgi:hypothetical protein
MAKKQVTKIELNEHNFITAAKRVQELVNYGKRKEAQKIQFNKEEKDGKTFFSIEVKGDIDAEFIFCLGYYIGLKKQH